MMFRYGRGLTPTLLSDLILRPDRSNLQGFRAGCARLCYHGDNPDFERIVENQHIVEEEQRVIQKNGSFLSLFLVR